MSHKYCKKAFQLSSFLHSISKCTTCIFTINHLILSHAKYYILDTVLINRNEYHTLHVIHIWPPHIGMKTHLLINSLKNKEQKTTAFIPFTICERFLFFIALTCSNFIESWFKKQSVYGSINFQLIPFFLFYDTPTKVCAFFLWNEKI